MTVPMKLPSLNEYINACRTNRYEAAKMKRDLEQEIGAFVRKLPKFDYPVRITFVWQEKNKRRDLDNVAFAKKFLLDALVKAGRIKDDNRRNVTGFTDQFTYGDWGVTMIFERSEI